MSAQLSIRQRDVLGGLQRGETNKTIARDLGISPATVKWHVARVLSALQVQRRAQVAAIAIQQHTTASSITTRTTMPDDVASSIEFPTTPGTPYGGGLYAGRFCLGARVYGLVVPLPDLGELEATKWGSAKSVAGALSYNDGLANTHSMAAAGSALGKWALSLRIAGFDDFYVPSRLESLVAFGEVREAAQFARAWYWTSTQYADAAGYAWCQSYLDGYQYYDRKSSSLRARAVRRFLIQ